MLELFLILSCKNRKNSRYLYPKKLTENSKAETLKIKYKIKKKLHKTLHCNWRVWGVRENLQSRRL